MTFINLKQEMTCINLKQEMTFINLKQEMTFINLKQEMTFINLKQEMFCTHYLAIAKFVVSFPYCIHGKKLSGYETKQTSQQYCK